MHIKADGNWTNKLHELASSAQAGNKSQEDDGFTKIKVGIDGPFGAPAQRFYSFDKSLIIGAGIGNYIITRSSSLEDHRADT